MNNQEYSVVIASIGRPCLFATLDDICNSFFPPNEVIIVLPKNSNFTLPAKFKKYSPNISLLYAPKGQVKQRKVGLLNCNYENVVQLDDDIRFEPSLLSSLVDVVSKNPNKVVSPVFYNSDATICITGTKVKENHLLRFLYGANSKKDNMGVGYVSAIGLAIRPSFLKEKDLISSEWLPGGCMSYNKKFSTMDSDISSPAGKFFGEDLINSHIMRKKGAALFFVSKLSVCTEVAMVSKINEVISHFKSMLFIQKITHGKVFYCRTVIFCIIRYLYSLFVKRT